MTSSSDRLSKGRPWISHSGSHICTVLLTLGYYFLSFNSEGIITSCSCMGLILPRTHPWKQKIHCGAHTTNHEGVWDGEPHGHIHFPVFLTWQVCYVTRKQSCKANMVLWCQEWLGHTVQLGYYFSDFIENTTLSCHSSVPTPLNPITFSNFHGDRKSWCWSFFGGNGCNKYFRVDYSSKSRVFNLYIWDAIDSWG